MSYLDLENISLSFDDKLVLNDISLSVGKGELVTLLGPSGCGKSTLLRTIAGLEEPKTGSIKLDGEEIQHKRSRERNIGMVFQQYALFPTMTVFDNVAFGLKVKKLDKKIVQEKVDTVLSLVELEEFSDRYVTQLSGGQQQRVALARALVVEPKLLLLDEPLSALDARIRKQLQLEIRAIQKELGITMVFVTHDQEEAMRISDRIYVLSEGKLEQASSPNELYTQPKSQFVAEFIGDYNHIQSIDLIGKIGTNQYKKYFVRPEVIMFEETPNSIDISVAFENQIILGNVIRYQFRTSENQTIFVDRLNNGKILDIKDIKKVYIQEDDLLRIK
ncbi:ABC transporter ATP-binding protein [Vagococcus bubulae]|uniref:ABC-type quaternary amine transporter n=1 Tax=Vagococcus bubulae TaxID=1977868 RepID=A0A429ZLT1_9ENTE|nr:ABC transporter ATP-binding protein [Vagococcus bubulae]RST94651.1 ABC transporter ATP-binding protein [Vagococcus bubulae]